MMPAVRADVAIRASVACGAGTPDSARRSGVPCALPRDHEASVQQPEKGRRHERRREVAEQQPDAGQHQQHAQVHRVAGEAVRAGLDQRRRRRERPHCGAGPFAMALAPDQTANATPARIGTTPASATGQGISRATGSSRCSATIARTASANHSGGMSQGRRPLTASDSDEAGRRLSASRSRA
jgi:hypothetical protein